MELCIFVVKSRWNPLWKKWKVFCFDTFLSYFIFGMKIQTFQGPIQYFSVSEICFDTLYRCFWWISTIQHVCLLFFPPSVKKRHSRWTHNEMSSLRVKCKKKVLQVVILIVFQQCIKKTEVKITVSGSRYARLLRITE